MISNLISTDFSTRCTRFLSLPTPRPHTASPYFEWTEIRTLWRRSGSRIQFVYAGTESSLKGARAANPPKVLSNLPNRNIDNIDSGGWLSYRLYSQSYIYRRRNVGGIEPPHFSNSCYTLPYFQWHIYRWWLCTSPTPLFACFPHHCPSVQ